MVPVLKNGEVFALLGVRIPSEVQVADAEGELLYLAGLLWELLRQKAVEEALLLSEARYEAFVNPSGDMLVLRDEHLRFVMVNEVLSAFLGRQQEDLTGLRYRNVLDEDAAQKLEEQGRRVLEGNRRDAFEERLNGIYFESIQFPVRMGEKVLVGGILRNITARKAAESALEESQRMYVGLVNNLPGFVYRCLADHDWTMLYISEGCTRITGYSPADLIGNQVLAFNDLNAPE